MHGLFITGTDTGVGKTVVAAALMHRLRDYGPLCYWKPIQTGIEVDDDTATVKLLGTCREAEVLDSGIRLPRPLSPHLAAQLAGEEIDVELLAQTVETRAGVSHWIVEGAGGALVPINDRYLMIDFMARLKLGVLVVARSTLGTINHTLMTLEALRRRTLPVAGVVMVGDPNPANRESIEQFGNIAVVAEMPIFQTLTDVEIATWARAGMDPGGILQEFLQ
jgi:dethiobiotin synthetase